ncbi:MAG: 50S ribosomal protein L25 [Candidatus Pacebacteria bacterium]|nr:50S ribosomal protein L25 [Candidatus Paceibacterota bacterium]
MEKLVITAENRNAEETSAKKILEEGSIPGVVYGHGFENISIKVGRKEFLNTLNEAGESTLIDLKIGDKEIGNVVIKDYQVDPLTGAITHFDFHKIKMTEKLIVNVDLVFIGESSAEKNEGGILVKSMDMLEIKCLPKDLIQEIEIDLGKLEHLDDMIRVKDLVLSDKVEILDEEENVIVSVVPQRSDEEMEDLEEKPEENVSKVEGAVKEEEEVPATEKKAEKK